MIGLNFSGSGQFGFAIIFLGSGKVGKKNLGSGFWVFGYPTHHSVVHIM